VRCASAGRDNSRLENPPIDAVLHSLMKFLLLVPTWEQRVSSIDDLPFVTSSGVPPLASW